jgi:hypothetical protein
LRVYYDVQAMGTGASGFVADGSDGTAIVNVVVKVLGSGAGLEVAVSDPRLVELSDWVRHEIRGIPVHRIHLTPVKHDEGESA